LEQIKTPHNSTYKKLAVQWLNEVLRFVSSFVVNQTLVLRINICGENRHLRQAPNRYGQG